MLKSPVNDCSKIQNVILSAEYPPCGWFRSLFSLCNIVPESAKSIRCFFHPHETADGVSGNRRKKRDRPENGDGYIPRQERSIDRRVPEKKRFFPVPAERYPGFPFEKSANHDIVMDAKTQKKLSHRKRSKAMHKAVITGRGLVTPIGTGLAANLESLASV